MLLFFHTSPRFPFCFPFSGRSVNNFRPHRVAVFILSGKTVFPTPLTSAAVCWEKMWPFRMTLLFFQQRSARVCYDGCPCLMAYIAWVGAARAAPTHRRTLCCENVAVLFLSANTTASTAGNIWLKLSRFAIFRRHRAQKQHRLHQGQ